MQIVQKYICKQDLGNIDGNALSLKVVLTLDQRRKSRQRLKLSNGEFVGLSIERGLVLRDGDVLVTDDGQHILVCAAQENVLHVTADQTIDLIRAAYHLGNRHVTLEVGADYLQLEHDPILKDMLKQLGGVQVANIKAAFEPEIGAYGGGHKHGHDETFAEDYALAQAAFHAHHHD